MCDRVINKFIFPLSPSAQDSFWYLTPYHQQRQRYIHNCPKKTLSTIHPMNAIGDNYQDKLKLLTLSQDKVPVEEMVNACDAGRELIFCFVYQMAGCKQSMRRLWISQWKAGFAKEQLRQRSTSRNQNKGILHPETDTVKRRRRPIKIPPITMTVKLLTLQLFPITMYLLQYITFIHYLN